MREIGRFHVRNSTSSRYICADGRELNAPWTMEDCLYPANSTSVILIFPMRESYRLEILSYLTKMATAPSRKGLAMTPSREGYPCYVDTFDPTIDGDSPHLESYVRQVIGRCRALMAIVSTATISSWWVPLEIGVALEKEKHMATFLLTEVDLPSYLWQWADAAE